MAVEPLTFRESNKSSSFERVLTRRRPSSSRTCGPSRVWGDEDAYLKFALGISVRRSKLGGARVTRDVKRGAQGIGSVEPPVPVQRAKEQMQWRHCPLVWGFGADQIEHRVHNHTRKPPWNKILARNNKARNQLGQSSVLANHSSMIDTDAGRPSKHARTHLDNVSVDHPR